MIERRKRRSQVHVEALAIFLEAQRTALGARGLVVTTRQGRVLAGADPSPNHLAGMALRVGESTEVAKGDKAKIATWNLRAGDHEVILASRGGLLSHELGSGVRRILSSLAD